MKVVRAHPGKVIDRGTDLEVYFREEGEPVCLLWRDGI